MLRYGFTRDFGKKEKIKAKEGAQMNCVEVKIKIEQIQKKYEKPCLKKNNRRKRQLEEAVLEKSENN